MDWKKINQDMGDYLDTLLADYECKKNLCSVLLYICK